MDDFQYLDIRVSLYSQRKWFCVVESHGPFKSVKFWSHLFQFRFPTFSLKYSLEYISIQLFLFGWWMDSNEEIKEPPLPLVNTRLNKCLDIKVKKSEEEIDNLTTAESTTSKQNSPNWWKLFVPTSVRCTCLSPTFFVAMHPNCVHSCTFGCTTWHKF